MQSWQRFFDGKHDKPDLPKGVLGILKGQGSDRYRDGHGHGHGHDHGNGPWPHDHGHGLGFGQDQGQGEGQGQGPAMGQPKPCRGLAGAWPGSEAWLGARWDPSGLGPVVYSGAQWFIPVPSGLPVVFSSGLFACLPCLADALFHFSRHQLF